MLKLFLVSFSLIVLCGCTATAKQYEKDGVKVMEADRGVKADFANHTIESDPWIKFPEFPIRIDK